MREIGERIDVGEKSIIELREVWRQCNIISSCIPDRLMGERVGNECEEDEKTRKSEKMMRKRNRSKDR